MDEQGRWLLLFVRYVRGVWHTVWHVAWRVAG
jgi:hypothetical protein